jgi:hypothetical protein
MNFKTRVFFPVLSALMLLVFQNCQQVKFNPSSGLAMAQSTPSNVVSTPTPPSSGPNPAPAEVVAAIALSSQTIYTKKNQPVTFNMTVTGGVTSLSLANTQGVLSQTSTNGQLQIQDSKAGALQYNPGPEFVGTDTFTVYDIDASGKVVSATVTAVVGNIVNLMQPALAVRGISCITCHSQVASNVITDYGAGDPWYFDTKTNDSFYADRLDSGNGLATLNLLKNSTLFVPKVAAPNSVLSLSSTISSLADFVKFRFSQGSTNSASQVQEVANLKIMIPTQSRIQQVFGNPTKNSVYLKDTQLSPDLKGLNYDSTNNVFIINSMICDGDLYLNAPVLLQNAQITSVQGCRIYAVQSVFIDGALTSLPFDGSTNHNIQILSAESIWAGTGPLWKSGKYCDVDSNNKPTGWYTYGPGFDCSSDSKNSSKASCDSFMLRTWASLTRNTLTRSNSTSTSLDSILQTYGYTGKDGLFELEKKSIEASIKDSLYDASCGSAGRGVPMNRILLAAPYINSRYNGNVSGAIISEAAIMSLGTFTFTFDPIFKSVSIFSLLTTNELVSVQP